MYSTQQVADTLNIGRSTVNKYARGLEKANYNFKKDEKVQRAFTEHDLVMFRALVELLSRCVHYDSAIKAISMRYKTDPDSHYVPIAAITDSTNFVKMEEHPSAVMLAIQSLSKRIDKTIDTRVKSEVAPQLQHNCLRRLNDIVELLAQTN